MTMNAQPSTNYKLLLAVSAPLLALLALGLVFLVVSLASDPGTSTNYTPTTTTRTTTVDRGRTSCDGQWNQLSAEWRAVYGSKAEFIAYCIDSYRN